MDENTRSKVGNLFCGGYRSHYFVSDLTSFESAKVLDTLLEISLNKNTSDLNFQYSIPGLLRHKYINNKNITARVKELLFNFFKDNDGYIFYSGLDDYLIQANMLSDEDIILVLKSIFEDDEFSKDDRKTALSLLLKADSTKWLGFYLENYESLSNKAEAIFTKIILKWSGPLIDKLISKIKVSGNDLCKELIQRKEGDKQKKQDEAAQQEQTEYQNSKIIDNIHDLRSRINLITMGDDRFDFKLFPPNELLIKQMKSISKREQLTNACIDLRKIVQDFDKNIKKHGVTFEDAKTIINGLSEETFQKSINAFHIFLSDRGINVDKDVFGLRNLNKILAKFLHPETEQELVNLLKEIGLLEEYNKKDYSSVHRKILSMYHDILEKIMNAIQSKNE